MGWSFSVKQRDKIALAMGVIFLVIILAYWFVTYSAAQVSGHFKSVYEDRLVPALDISAITEHNYKNHMLLEEHILSAETKEKVKLQAEMQRNQEAIDSLVVKFAATFLTQQEARDLQKYKQAQKGLLAVQNSILDLSNAHKLETATSTYNTLGKEKFRQLLEPLHALSQVQETVGHELYASAGRSITTIKVLSYLIIGMAVVIALLVATLLQTSRKLNAVKHQNFNMN